MVPHSSPRLEPVYRQRLHWIEGKWGPLEERPEYAAKNLYFSSFSWCSQKTRGWPQQKILIISMQDDLSCKCQSPSNFSRPCHHPTDSEIKWPLWQEWRLFIVSFNSLNLLCIYLVNLTWGFLWQTPSFIEI